MYIYIYIYILLLLTYEYACYYGSARASPAGFFRGGLLSGGSPLLREVSPLKTRPWQEAERQDASSWRRSGGRVCFPQRERSHLQKERNRTQVFTRDRSHHPHSKSRARSIVTRSIPFPPNKKNSSLIVSNKIDPIWRNTLFGKSWLVSRSSFLLRPGRATCSLCALAPLRLWRTLNSITRGILYGEATCWILGSVECGWDPHRDPLAGKQCFAGPTSHAEKQGMVSPSSRLQTAWFERCSANHSRIDSRSVSVEPCC